MSTAQTGADLRKAGPDPGLTTMQTQANSLSPETTACKTSKPDSPYLHIPEAYILTILSASGFAVPHAAPAWPLSAWTET